MNRKEANLKILAILAEFFEKYPNQRFGQALVNLDVLIYRPKSLDDLGYLTEDPFYNESEAILERTELGYAKILKGE